MNDKVNHEISLIYGAAFRVAYKTFGKESKITQNLLAKYRNSRRMISGGKDSSGYSTRYGASEAYDSTQ